MIDAHREKHCKRKWRSLSVKTGGIGRGCHVDIWYKLYKL